MLRHATVSALVGLALCGAGCSAGRQPDALSCPASGQTQCDITGTKLVVCKANTDGELFWGQPTPCPGGKPCVDGACESECPVCDQPPTQCHQSAGSCVAGSCQYRFKEDGAQCDDGDPCTEQDQCVAGSCVGSAIRCDEPPQNNCKDASTLTAYPLQGVCEQGSCVYTPTEISCGVGCAEGSCLGDPCQGVVCDQPPSACHQLKGLCSSGSCTYLYDDGKLCDDKDACTSGDKCSGGECVGVEKVCDQPPADVCKDGSTLVLHDKTGLCDAGTCSYGSKEVPCAHGCDSSKGACKADPCANIVCDSPPNVCYQKLGSCSNGSCSYELFNGNNCDDGNPCTQSDTCVGGTCVGSAVVCNTAPPNTCKDGSTLTVYSVPGYCSGGTCNYGSVEVGCSFGCDTLNGICKGDPCANVECKTPPNSECFTSPGICSAGQCTYLPKTGVSCDDGDSCTKADKCDGTGSCSGTPYTCDDGVDCTDNTCDGQGGCSFPVASTACLMALNGDTLCFDQGDVNPISACQSCVPQSSQSRWTVSSGPKLYQWSFDSGTSDGFVFTPDPPSSPVKWQVDGNRTASGSYALYFGDTTSRTYADGSSQVTGQATSPLITLTPAATAGKLCLTFQLFKDTEASASYDLLTVVLLETGNPAIELWTSATEVAYGNSTSYFAVGVDLTAHAGKTVQLRFAFDSIDEYFNSGEGVYIDEIKVMTNCAP